MVTALERSMTAPSMPLEILQMLLDLAEFMERADKPLPIDTKVPHLPTLITHA